MNSANPHPVLLMVRTLGPGGTERQVATLAQFLDRKRFQPHVACFENVGCRIEELRRCHIPILLLPLTGFVNFDCLRSLDILRRYVHEQGIQLVHSFDWPANIFVMGAQLLRGPIVLSSQRSFRSQIPFKYRWAIHWSDRVVDGIVVNCMAVRRHLIEDHFVPEKKVHLCYNVLDTSQFNPLARRRPAELHDADVVIGTVSVLRAVKSIETLLEAFSKLCPQRRNLRLVIVGSGERRLFLEKSARAFGISHECVFHEATDAVGDWLRAIDIFVLPSLSEGFSNSLMEAMACGCCVVASRVGGTEELVQHAKNGLLFERGNVAELADLLNTLIGDGNLRRSLASEGADWVAREFSPARTVTCMEKIYEKELAAKLR